MPVAYKHTQIVQSGATALDLDPHLQQWADAGWTLVSFSTSATMTPGGLAMGGLRVFYDFVWKHEGVAA